MVKKKKELEDLVNNPDMKKLLKYAKEKGLNPKDLLTVAKAASTGNPDKKVSYTIGKNHVKIGYIGDTHIGNIKYTPSLMKHAVKEFNFHNVDFVIHGGDIVDGWYQNRPTSLFEQNAIGFDQQLDLAVKELRQLNQPFYFITANHEYNTFMRGAGVELGHVLEDKLNQTGMESHFLGNQEGDIKLKNGTKIKIFHPDGGTAYAISYRPQKIAEAFTGGEKPGLMFVAHFHKLEYLFYRNIHIFQGGTLCGQTKFMRGKNIPAHKGFWIIDLYTSKEGHIDKIIPHMYPAYD